MSELTGILWPQPATATKPADPLAALDALRASWACRPPPKSKTKKPDNADDLNFGGDVEKYLIDWQVIRAYFEEKGLPCHSFAGGEMCTCTTAHAYIYSGERRSPLPDPKVVSMMGAVSFEITVPDSVRLSDRVWISVPEDAVERHRAHGWAVWHPPMSTRTPTDHGYWRDAREPARFVQDSDSYSDDPLSLGTYHLAQGYELLSRWSDGGWEHGDLLGTGGADWSVRRKTATYAHAKDWDKITDPRVATSTGHVMKRGRPRAVAPGWGGYDEFTTWQASGRLVQSWMPKKLDRVVTDVTQEIPFVGKQGRAGPKVHNRVPKLSLPHQGDPPKPLYAVMPRKFQPH